MTSVAPVTGLRLSRKGDFFGVAFFGCTLLSRNACGELLRLDLGGLPLPRLGVLVKLGTLDSELVDSFRGLPLLCGVSRTLVCDAGFRGLFRVLLRPYSGSSNAAAVEARELGVATVISCSMVFGWGRPSGGIANFLKNEVIF